MTHEANERALRKLIRLLAVGEFLWIAALVASLALHVPRYAAVAAGMFAIDLGFMAIFGFISRKTRQPATDRSA